MQFHCIRPNKELSNWKLLYRTVWKPKKNTTVSLKVSYSMNQLSEETLWTRFLEILRFGMVNFLTQPLRIESETDFLASFLKFQSQPNKSVHFFFTPAQLFKKFSFGNEGTVIKMTRNLEENKYFPLRMNEKSEELLVFQKLRKLGLNSSFAFFSTHKLKLQLNNFSRWQVDKPLCVWWPPQQILLCHSSELTCNNIIAPYRSESMCFSSKFIHLGGQQIKFKITWVETSILKFKFWNFAKKLRWAIHLFQSQLFDNFWFLPPKWKVEPLRLNWKH